MWLRDILPSSWTPDLPYHSERLRWSAGACTKCGVGRYCRAKNALYLKVRSELKDRSGTSADVLAADQDVWSKYFAQKEGTQGYTMGLDEAIGAATSVCGACPSGKYQESTGSYKCKSCPGGKYSVLVSRTFQSRTIVEQPLTSCIACPAGYFRRFSASPKDGKECVACGGGLDQVVHVTISSCYNCNNATHPPSRLPHVSPTYGVAC